MRQIQIAVLLMVFSYLAPPVVHPSAYRWVDDKGVTHFTDNSDNIPARYLKRAGELPSVSSEKSPAADATISHSAPGPHFPQTAQTAPAASAAATGAVPTAPPPRDPAERGRLATELKEVREELAVKRKELERLRHKWTVVKGRTPSEEELKEFEKKKREGKATYKDNPYVNKSPLSSPARARSAYFQKLEEVRKDEERARQLERELQEIR